MQVRDFKRYTPLYYPIRRILKSLGLFENLAFVIMSTRENIRLIARASLLVSGATFTFKSQSRVIEEIT